MGLSLAMSPATPSRPGPARIGRWPRGLVALLALSAVLVARAAPAEELNEAPGLTFQDNQLLDDLQKRAILYFAEHSEYDTGLTRDRAPNTGSETNAPASIAATGFALTAWCIADARGWLPPGYALERVRTTLRFVAKGVLPEKYAGKPASPSKAALKDPWDG